MKIVIKYSEDEYGGDRRETMDINGKYRFSVGSLSECPEDATIGRDLISCEEVSKYMKEAFDAGKLGEDFSVEIVPDNEEDEDG